MKLSTIIREAANNYLSQKGDVSFGLIGLSAGKYDYSCDAIRNALSLHYPNYSEYYFAQECLESILKSFGTPIHSTLAFEEFEEGEERQSVRYAWLMFLADVAEEENLEI